jgi:hypothetical protein
MLKVYKLGIDVATVFSPEQQWCPVCGGTDFLERPGTNVPVMCTRCLAGFYLEWDGSGDVLARVICAPYHDGWDGRYTIDPSRRVYPRSDWGWENELMWEAWGTLAKRGASVKQARLMAEPVRFVQLWTSRNCPPTLSWSGRGWNGHPEIREPVGKAQADADP